MISNKTALMVASVPSMIGQFNMANISIWQELGYKVIVACNFNDRSVWTDARVDEFMSELDEKGITTCQIDLPRKPTKISMIRKSYFQLDDVVNKYNVGLIHCHTPVASIVARKVAHKNNIKVIYTAHGFHFFKGAPLKNWLFYYPVEKFCAHFTDVLITINQEDYTLARKKMKAKQVEYVPGVGIDLTKFGQVVIDKSEKRKELGIPEYATLLLSVGELNENKNHETVIRAIKDLDVYYIIAGNGDLQKHLQDVICEFGLTERVKLLGYRTDVAELYQTADVYVLPSVREGLNVSIMEAMASGLPVVCGRIRGNVDLIDKHGGALFEPRSVDECKKTLEDVLGCEKNLLGIYNLKKVQMMSIEKVNTKMKALYLRD